jgi:hypothetical protein
VPCSLYLFSHVIGISTSRFVWCERVTSRRKSFSNSRSVATDFLNVRVIIRRCKKKRFLFIGTKHNIVRACYPCRPRIASVSLLERKNPVVCRRIPLVGRYHAHHVLDCSHVWWPSTGQPRSRRDRHKHFHIWRLLQRCRLQKF